MFPQYRAERAFEPRARRGEQDFAVAFGGVSEYNSGTKWGKVEESVQACGTVWGHGAYWHYWYSAAWYEKTREEPPMLTGEYQHNMDPKGRVTVPSKFREDLGDKFYVCKGLDGCLFVLSQSQWDKLCEKVAAMPLSKGKGIQRYFFSGAAEVEPDKQGRLLIPPNLREFAGLDKDVTLIGAAVRAEIWDTRRWQEYNDSQTEENLEESMELLDF